MIIAGTDVENETGSMDSVARVWLFPGGIAAQDVAQFIQAEASRDNAHPVVDGQHEFLAKILKI